MSLYTPVFPSLRGRGNPSRRNSYTSAQNTQRYADVLRDVHLFLSTQGEELSPPSRPSSPNFEERVSHLRERVKEAFYDAKGEPSNGLWTNLSEQLRMGCVKGRYHPLSGDGQRVLGENVEWILPETEEDWFVLEKKREEARRLKKLAASQQGRSVPAFQQSSASNLARANSTLPCQDEVFEQGVSTVSQETIRKAKEKVSKWQATIVPGSVPEFERPQAPLKTNVDSSVLKGKPLVREKTSSSLNFPVVKRAAGTLDGKGERRPPLGYPVSNNLVGLGDSRVTYTAQRSTGDVGDTRGGKIVVVDSNGTRKTGLTAGTKPKINDYPEMSYLPPSFPSQLSTSTPPQRAPGLSARMKPPPILPLPPSSSTPSPSTPPVQDHIGQEPRAANVLSHSPQFDTPQLLHPLRPFPSDVPIESPTTQTKKRTAPFRVTPPAGFEDEIVARSPAHETDVWKAPPGETRRSAASEAFIAPAPAPTHRVEAGSTTPKVPSPTKSYFSSHASSPSASPVSNRNLLLHSPENPILCLADEPNTFRPPHTSTQNGPKAFGPTSSDPLGMGYSSQFNVEKHVDRVTELLEKDVDFNSWLKDVNTVDDAYEEPGT